MFLVQARSIEEARNSKMKKGRVHNVPSFGLRSVPGLIISRIKWCMRLAAPYSIWYKKHCAKDAWMYLSLLAVIRNSIEIKGIIMIKYRSTKALMTSLSSHNSPRTMTLQFKTISAIKPAWNANQDFKKLPASTKRETKRSHGFKNTSCASDLWKFHRLLRIGLSKPWDKLFVFAK